MTTLRMLSLYALIGFVCGCGSPQAEPETSAGNDSRKGPVASQKQESNGKPESVQEITFYLAGMNKGLKILWGDWPNKVKKALLELKGVSLVEDEWQRKLGLDSGEDLDVLFVGYDPKVVTVEQMQALIKKHGFVATVKQHKPPLKVE